MVLAHESACSFPAELQSVRTSRLFVQRELGVEADHPAALCVSELSTNAVRHARSGFRVVVAGIPGGVRVEVHDDASAQPRPRVADEHSMGGRGLMIVEQLADSWGADGSDDGTKSVWFELTL